MSKASKQENLAEPEVAASEGSVAQAIVDASNEIKVDPAIVWADPEPADPDIHLPTPAKDSDYATFRSLRAKDLWVTLKSTDMVVVQRPDGSAMKVKAENRGEYPDGPFIAKFSMGMFRTKNKAVIIGLLNAAQFGVGFGIDPVDPTGYWRRHGVIKEREVKTVQMDVEQDPNAIRLIAGAIGVKDRPQTGA